MQPEAVASGKGFVGFGLDMLKREGPRAFYKGFIMNWMRLSAFNISLWLVFERVKIVSEGILGKKTEENYSQLRRRVSK